MSHARLAIRQHVVALLSDIPDVTVINSRVYKMLNLPVISVYTLNEVSESENELIGTPRRYTRRMTLEIAIAVTESEQADEMADNYAAQCEILMASDVTLGGLATDSELTATNTQGDGSGEKAIFITRLSYEVWYRTTGADPATAI